jgi:hypothetical protein
MYVYFMNNPVGARVGDCAVRAISKVLNISWEEAYAKLCVNGYKMGDMPSSNNVIASVLRMNGFHRQNLPDFCPDCYTVSQFAQDNPVGKYVLGTGSHVVALINGDWFDSWNSADEVPQYFWTK